MSLASAAQGLRENVDLHGLLNCRRPDAEWMMSIPRRTVQYLMPSDTNMRTVFVDNSIDLSGGVPL